MYKFILFKTTRPEAGKADMTAYVFATRAARDEEFDAVVTQNEALEPSPFGGFFQPDGFIDPARRTCAAERVEALVAEVAAKEAWNYRHPTSGADAVVSVEIVEVAQ